MKDTLILQDGNRSVFAVVWARQAGTCGYCHGAIEVWDKIIIRPGSGMEHAHPETCFASLVERGISPSTYISTSRELKKAA